MGKKLLKLGLMGLAGLLGCRTISVPLFDIEPVLQKYPMLKGVIVRAENYIPVYPKDRPRRWVIDEEIIVDVGTTIKIEVIQHPELTREYVIPSDGIIQIPQYVPKIKALRKSIRQLRIELEAELSRYIKDPKVIISVLPPQHRHKKEGEVIICGRVNRSVRAPLSSAPYLFLLLARTGGIEEDAAITQIMIIRQEIDGSFRVIVCNWVKFQTEHDRRQNLALQSGDIVIVPKIYSEEKDLAEELQHIVLYISGAITKQELLYRLSE
jgi:protein involved in polysaccharide export with SLBB domain